VTPYHGKIQDKDAEYYSQFHIIICGLDSVEVFFFIKLGSSLD
jgi:ubiquitin-activating enzyme E1 C